MFLFFFILDIWDIFVIDFVFVLSVVVVDVDDIFDKMKNIVDIIVKFYGVDKIWYVFVIFGDKVNIVVDFDNDCGKDVFRIIV